MCFNRLGELVPVASGCRDCGACLSVCPSLNALPGDQYATYFGEYLKCYAAYSKHGRERGRCASGGLVTRLLKAMLGQRLVTKAVVVRFTGDAGKLFEASIATTAEEIERCAGSRYYPVELSAMVKDVAANDDSYVFVGLPCAIRGLALLKRRAPFSERIKFLFGLTCLWNKNKYYTDFLLDLAGAAGKELGALTYRGKEGLEHAQQSYLLAHLRNGRVGGKIDYDAWIRLWSGGFFTIRRCEHCTDLFGEHADASFMDAWVEPYVRDPRGTSFMIVRNEEVRKLLEQEARAERITLTPIAESEVLNSQRAAVSIKKFARRSRLLALNRRLSRVLYGNGLCWNAAAGPRTLLLLWVRLYWQARELYRRTRGSSR